MKMAAARRRRKVCVMISEREREERESRVREGESWLGPTRDRGGTGLLQINQFSFLFW